MNEKLLSKHDYFRKVWLGLGVEDREKIFEMIASGKVITPYEKIKKFDRLDLASENRDVFEKYDFFLVNLKTRQLQMKNMKMQKFCSKS